MQAFLPLYFLAELQGFSEVSFGDVLTIVQVGDCAGDFEGFEVGAGGKIKSFGSSVQELLIGAAKRAELRGFIGAE